MIDPRQNAISTRATLTVTVYNISNQSLVRISMYLIKCITHLTRLNKMIVHDKIQPISEKNGWKNLFDLKTIYEICKITKRNAELTMISQG